MPRPRPRLRPATRRVTALAVAVVVAGTLAACTDDGTDGPTPTGSGDGTLTTLSLGPVDTWDPQRIASRQDAAFAGRTWLRTLTAWTPAAAGEPAQLVGDLATDTGTPDRTLRTWTFTLKDDVRWQDGSEVTCADVAYGISRGFATELEGPNWAPSVLAVPRSATGASTYAGPYTGTGQAAYDQAVTCADRTLTVRLGTADADFAELVSLPSFAPFKESQDRGSASRYTVFSTGPFMLSGAWEPSSGGTFVRNPHWSAETDPVRSPRVQRIAYQEGVESQTAIQQVMDDKGTGRTSVALAPAPPALQQQIAGADRLSGRATEVPDELVDYLAPVWTSPIMSKPLARKALATATNRAAYVTALGGSGSAEPAATLLPPSVPGHTDEDVLGIGPSGDPDAARALLRQAGLPDPVPLRVAYRTGATADKAMAALQSGWEAAGFAVTLQPITDDYFTTVATAARAANSDVLWGTWEPAWPSAATVLPVLFDSRLNLTATTSGRDLGRYTSTKTNAEVTRIAAITDRDDREEAWATLDRALVQEGAYVPLAQRTNTYIAGSGVQRVQTSSALGGVVDLARVGLR